jgi:hypothetical protein
MLKASALYMVIVIALVIGVVCSSLIVVAYFYKSEYQRKFRYDQLRNNLNSGINILLASNADSAYSHQTTLSLFNKEADSVTIQKSNWGIYDICTVKAYIQNDTLFKTFLIANSVDSAKWATIYLADEDRPVSVTGKTSITGNVFIPKAGIQSAYIDNHAYAGDKRIVIGEKHTSDKKLPVLDTLRLNLLDRNFSAKGDPIVNKDTIIQSFLKNTRIFDFKNAVQTLDHIRLKGNILLHSDTTLIIDSTVSLSNVLVFARSIIVKDGFRGNCQLFATDSISVGKNCHFVYPSCLGIIRLKAPKIIAQTKISLGENTIFGGIIFTDEKNPGSVKPIISLNKNDTIKGLVYSQDALALKDQCVFYGSVFTNRFVYKTSYTLYENYLINTTFNSKDLSPYYLTSPVTPVASKKKKLLLWLEGN